MEYKDLSQEQQRFVDVARAGRSILVDACIGSGKTTAIQSLCGLLPANRQILYLTYNKLLKLDAKSKITQPNAYATNYHGFAYMECLRHRMRTSVQECISNYVKSGFRTRRYDVLILDEYQDIDEEIAAMLEHIKRCNPGLQIIAVGDMAQKIYDATRLDVSKFITGFLPIDHVKLEFTQCFRLSAEHAADLGDIWGKKIVGVNPDCEILKMTFKEAVEFLAASNPGDVLCLGSNAGGRSRMLNILEEEYPDKFNKRTIWSKISDNDGGATNPSPGIGIFTTYDGCKGMERDICVIFDWNEEYWYTRLQKPNARYEILRNIFCVAASRGKRKIVFVTPGDDKPELSKRVLMDDSAYGGEIRGFAISTMFDFKYAEDVADAFRLLDTHVIQRAGGTINASTKDCLIDLSPCIGIYQEAGYFDGYDIDAAIRNWFEMQGAMGNDVEFKHVKGFEKWSVEQKVLYLTSLETGQDRYLQQVGLPFIRPEHCAEIANRLATRVGRDATVQVATALTFGRPYGEPAFQAKGFADVVEGDMVIELKFVSELTYTHFLQCAMYMIGLNKPTGVLWNVRDNVAHEIRIPDRERLMAAVVTAITKHRGGYKWLPGYYGPGQAAAGSGRAAKQPVDQKAAQLKAIESALGALTEADVLGDGAHDPKNSAETRVLRFCHENRPVTARALQVFVNSGFSAEPETVREVYSIYADAGTRPPYKARTFFKYFRTYFKIASTGHGKGGK